LSKKHQFPPDLTIAFRDSMDSRDDRSHPPALKFARVNRPAFDMLLVSPFPPEIPIPGFEPAVPPARQFRPRGFSPPRRFELSNSSGFVAPQYRTGFVVFPARTTRIRRSWPTACLSQTTHSHP
jgi:hypothetical protein